MLLEKHLEQSGLGGSKMLPLFYNVPYQKSMKAAFV
jgi:hypothetical protein